jgi:hypothetical protein
MTENHEINQRICRLLDNLIAITDLFNERIEEQIEQTRKETEEQNEFFPLKNKSSLFLLVGKWTCPIKNGRDLIEIKYIGTKRIFILYHYSIFGKQRAIKHLSHGIIDRNEERFLNTYLKGRFFYVDDIPLEYNKVHSEIRFKEKVFTREEE